MTAARTSATHPLYIAAVSPGEGFGRIGITMCPGKVQADAMSGSWARDLNADLDAIRDWGAVAVVTLVEDHELRALQVTGMGDAVRGRGMAWHHLPITDVATPDHRFAALWPAVGPDVRQRLRHGFDIVIHCKGGLGRAGTVAASLLVELGIVPDAAIAMVRAVRPGAIETGAQEDFVRSRSLVIEASPATDAAAIGGRAVGALVGLAVGDAVGTTLEFTRRDTRPRLTDMVGGGPFGLAPGQWTDDTAMALALGESLLAHPELDPADLMARFVDWWRDGRYSCTGNCFDIGTTTAAALSRWRNNGDPFAGDTDPATAGNGSLMRLAPVAIIAWASPDRAARLAAIQSRTTHGAPQAVAACTAYARLLAKAIGGARADDLLASGTVDQTGDPAIDAILAGSWRGKIRSKIHSSGYVAHSLEAALWCVARTGSFAEAILLAANLGDDADTTAAIAGQLAGAIYGVSAIPAVWRQRLAWGQQIETLATALLAAGDI